MPGSWTSPSGSRWEPAPGSGAATAAAPEPTAPAAPGQGDADERPARRRRGPVLVALVALLGLGGLGAGAYSYERSAGDGTPAATAAREPGASADGQNRRDGHRDRDHRGGEADDAREGGHLPGADDDR